MKYSGALEQISTAHRTALELADQIARAGDEASISRLMESVPTTFDRLLEPHLRLEEATLLRELEAAGESELVRRTLDEHQNVRDLAARVASGDRESLKLFWIALHALIRFEEQRVLHVAKEVLPRDLDTGEGDAPDRTSSSTP